MNTYYITNNITGQSAKIHGYSIADARERAGASKGVWTLVCIDCGMH